MIMKHVCANPGCSKKFRSTRADAEYCSNACKQAHYRARTKAKLAAEAVFRVKQNAENFEDNKRTAIDLYSKVKGIEVIATNTGVLVAETVPGARALAALMLPDWQQAPIQPQDVPALLRSAPVPRYSEAGEARRERARQDFRYRTAERDFRAAMKKPAHSISLFTFDGDAHQAKLASWIERANDPPVCHNFRGRWNSPCPPSRWQDALEDDRPKPEHEPQSDLSEWHGHHGVFVTDKPDLD